MAESTDRVFNPWPRLLGRWWAYLAMGLLIMGLDMLTGPYVDFPISFVLPVALCAWFCSGRGAQAQAVLLPLGRLAITHFIEHDTPLPHALINAGISIAVLAFISYLVARSARQTRELSERVATLEGFLPVCCYCKKIRDEREQWHAIEEYISTRAPVQFSHTFCPACFAEHYGLKVDAPRD